MMNLGLNIDKVIDHINNKKVNYVLIQLPDGLKPRAKEIVDKLELGTDARIYTYLGTCYGACDIPTDVQVDLVIQWGHSAWVY